MTEEQFGYAAIALKWLLIGLWTLAVTWIAANSDDGWVAPAIFGIVISVISLIIFMCVLFISYMG